MNSKSGHSLKVFHIPKTIDNDLRVHDHTPGYGSAARFVAAAMIGDNYDNAVKPGDTETLAVSVESDYVVVDL